MNNADNSICYCKSILPTLLTKISSTHIQTNRVSWSYDPAPRECELNIASFIFTKLGWKHAATSPHLQYTGYNFYKYNLFITIFTSRILISIFDYSSPQIPAKEDKNVMIQITGKQVVHVCCVHILCVGPS
jgi:hypothetical protein